MPKCMMNPHARKYVKEVSLGSAAATTIQSAARARMAQSTPRSTSSGSGYFKKATTNSDVRLDVSGRGSISDASGRATGDGK